MYNKDSINNNVKLFLSLFTTNELNSFNEFEFIPFNEIYGTLNRNLAGIVALDNEDIYDVFLDKVKELSKLKPYMTGLHEKLSSSAISDDFKSQFAAAFYLAKKTYLGSERVKSADGKTSYNILNLTDSGSKKTTILNKWYHNLTH